MHPNTATDFISHIQCEQSNGAQFIPLTGAGFSADSGILCGPEFLAYLRYAAYRYFEGWNIRVEGWPPMPGSVETSASNDWWKAIEAEACPSPHADALLVAAQDWRALLKFLAAIRLRPACTEPSRLRTVVDLESADDNVLVSFIDFLSRGKRPNTGHRLLAQLAEPLRVRLTLTTNFDALQEQAFHECRLPVDVFEVPNGVELPSSIAVGRSNTIVKLHGGRVHARADHTLDENPSTSNRETFSKYFGIPGRLSAPKHLLVMGFSANDKRIVRLIAEALVTQPRMKVFWVAHTLADGHAEKRLTDAVAERIQHRLPMDRGEEFDRAKERMELCVADAKKRIELCVARADEILQGIYLAITLTLPARTGEWALDDRATEIRDAADQRYLQVASCSVEQEPAFAVLASELIRRLGRPAWWEAIPTSIAQFTAFAKMAGDSVKEFEIRLCQYCENADLAALLAHAEDTPLQGKIKLCDESKLNEAALK
ncbi:MAG: hypothetical protein RL685_6692, partial [Pseudomonadota bacterium]